MLLDLKKGAFQTCQVVKKIKYIIILVNLYLITDIIVCVSLVKVVPLHRILQK